MAPPPQEQQENTIKKSIKNNTREKVWQKHNILLFISNDNEQACLLYW